jgi:hypothetical protein
MIFAQKAENGGPLFEAENDDVAKRNFMDLIKETQYSEEFALYRVGEVNYESMVITPSAPRLVVFGAGENFVEDEVGAFHV